MTAGDGLGVSSEGPGMFFSPTAEEVLPLPGSSWPRRMGLDNGRYGIIVGLNNGEQTG
jgi:hypothetical protein